MYRQKKYILGEYLEVEIFRRSERERPLKRAKKIKESLPAQKKLNCKNAVKTFNRLVHLNFSKADLFVDLTFSEEHLPDSRDDAVRLIKNYIERLRRARRKRQLEPMRYLYVISDHTESGEGARYHVHLIINGGLERSLVESAWGLGYANTQSLQPNELGVSDKAVYMARQGSGHGVRSWAGSKNLIRPEPIVSDKAITKADMERISRNPEDRQFFEKRYPGWVFTDCQWNYDFINGHSAYIRMRRYGPPKGGGRE